MMRGLNLLPERFVTVHEVSPVEVIPAEVGRVDVGCVEVGQAYFELHHLMHRIVDRTMSCAGLSFARTKVLMRIANEGPMNQATLAGLLGFAPRSVTETIDALEREGLVTRTEDPHDRRARIVAITPAGDEAHEAALAVKARAMTEIFGSLTSDERSRLLALFDTIRTSLVPGENCS